MGGREENSSPNRLYGWRDNKKRGRRKKGGREVRDEAEDKLMKDSVVCCFILRRRAGDDLNEL